MQLARGVRESFHAYRSMFDFTVQSTPSQPPSAFTIHVFHVSTSSHPLLIPVPKCSVLVAPASPTSIVLFASLREYPAASYRTA